MPRWWLWTFYGTIVWAAVYVVLFPARPLIHGATPGVLSYSSRGRVDAELAAQAAANAPLDQRLLEAPLATIRTIPSLSPRHRRHCRCSQQLRACHGSGAGGRQGFYPNPVDDDWLWGGTVTPISCRP